MEVKEHANLTDFQGPRGQQIKLDRLEFTQNSKIASESDMPSSLRERMDLDREFDIFLGGGAFGSGVKKGFSNTVDFSGQKISRNIDFCMLSGVEESKVSPVDSNPFVTVQN